MSLGRDGSPSRPPHIFKAGSESHALPLASHRRPYLRSRHRRSPTHSATCHPGVPPGTRNSCLHLCTFARGPTVFAPLHMQCPLLRSRSRVPACPLAASGHASALLPLLKPPTRRPRRDVPLMTRALAIAATYGAIPGTQAAESGRSLFHLTGAIVEVHAPDAGLSRRPGTKQLTQPREHRPISGRASTSTCRRRPPRGSSLGSH